MRVAATTAVVFSCMLLFAGNTAKAEAAPLDTDIKIATVPTTTSVLDMLEPAPEAEEPKEEPAKDPEPKKHTVANNETLTDIAKQYDTTWERLYAKNTQIDDPHFLNVGDEITIPEPDEKLAERALPEPPAPAEPAVPARSSASRTSARQAAPAQKAPARPRSTRVVARGSSAGNTYTRGYCTWYVKNRRPDLPNNLGNAYTWVARARAQGLATGSTPRVGAVGQQGNHVVYVEAVHGNGTITVSEMNYRGWNVISSRTASASAFTYIY